MARSLRLTALGAALFLGALGTELLAADAARGAASPESTKKPAAGAQAKTGDGRQLWDLLGGAEGCNGLVLAVQVADDGKVYAGGLFSACGGVAANNVAEFDPGAGSWKALGSGPSNGAAATVNAIAVAGGELFVGGDFTSAGGIPANRIARFDRAGRRWTSLGVAGRNGTNGSVKSLVVSGTNLYAGGSFSGVAGGPLAAIGVARFDLSTSIWWPLSQTGPNAPVDAIFLHQGSLFVSGEFTTVGGVSLPNLARLDLASRTWTPLGSGVNDDALAFAVRGNDLLVGGRFTQAGGVAANRVARFDLSTQTWSALTAGVSNGVNSVVYDLEVVDDDLIVAGAFTNAAGTAANAVARYDFDAQSWLPLGSGLSDQDVRSLARSGTTLFVGGGFTSSGGTAVSRVAEYSLAGSTFVALGRPAFNDEISSLVDRPDDIYVGGEFTTVAGITVNRIARFDKSLAQWFALGQGLNGEVDAMVWHQDALYVAGEFTTADGVEANRVARYDPALAAWNSLGNGAANGISGPAHALAGVADRMYVGGNMLSAGGVAAQNIAYFDLVAGTWHSTGGAGSAVRSMLQAGSVLFVGGGFTTAGGVPANRIARLDTSTGTWTALGSGVTESVHAIALADPYLVVGGNISQAGSEPSQMLGRFHFDTSTWSAVPGSTGSAVNALSTVGPGLFVAGQFSALGGAQASHVALLDPVTGSGASLGSGAANGMSNTVNAIARSDAALYFAGTANGAGGVTASSPIVARYDLRSEPGTTLSPSASAISIGDSITLTANVASAGFPAEAGTVAFLDGAAPVAGCEAVPLAGSGLARTAQCATTLLAAGVSRQLHAVYSGDALNADDVSEAVSVTVAAPTIAIAPAVAALPDGTANSSYSALLSASGGQAPYRWYVTGGTQPPGLALDENSGELSGIPTAQGNYSFAITAVDSHGVASNGPFHGMHSYTLRIAGVASATTLVTSGSPSIANNVVTFTATVSGQAPAGSVDFRADGTSIAGCAARSLTGSGNARTAECATSQLRAGVRSITAHYSGDPINANSASAALSQTVNAPTITVSPATLPNGFSGAPYSEQLTASGTAGSFAPYGFAVIAGGLPPGVTLSGSGLLAGTPSGGGTFNFTIEASDSSTSTVGGPFKGSRAYTIVIATEETSTSIVSSGSPSTVNTEVTFTATVAGLEPTGTVAFRDGANGIAGCNPVALVGSGNVRIASCATSALRTGNRAITAAYSGDSVNNASTSSVLTQTVNPPTLTVTPGALDGARTGVPYNAQLSTSGTGSTAPFTYVVTSGQLPTGITMSSTGAFTGSPATTGNFAFTVQAIDASAVSVGGPFSTLKTYLIEVELQPTVTTIGAIAPSPSIQGQQYSVPVTVTGVVGTPVGSVSCSEGASSVTVPLVGGTANCNLTSTAAGQRTITANYIGQGNFAASAANPVAHTVNPSTAGSESIVSVGTRLGVRGQGVAVPVVFRGDGDTVLFNAQINFNPDHLEFRGAVAVGGAICNRLPAPNDDRIFVQAPGTPTGLPLSPNLDTRFCELRFEIKPLAPGGTFVLGVVTSQCQDQGGINRTCMTSNGAINVSVIQTSLPTASLIAISGYEATGTASRRVILTNRGDANVGVSCALVGAAPAISLASPAPGGVAIAPGADSIVEVECVLPPLGTVLTGQLQCSTTDPVRPTLQYALSCQQVPDGTPLPEDQIFDEGLKAGDQLGTSASVSQRASSTEVLAVGAPFAGADTNGSVLIMESVSGAAGTTPAQSGKRAWATPGRFHRVARLSMPKRLSKGTIGAIGDKFGQAVAVAPDGEHIAVGAPSGGPDDSGLVLIYARPAGGWSEVDLDAPLATLAPPPLAGSTVGEFGASLAFGRSGDLAIGAPGTRTGASNVGAVFVFAPKGGSFVASEALQSLAPQANGRFGAALDIAIDPDGSGVLVIGAPDEGPLGQATGRAYMVPIAGGAYGIPQAIEANSGIGDKFGSSVSARNGIVVIGAERSDAAGTDSGRAIVYRRTLDGSLDQFTTLVPPPGASQGAGAAVATNGDVVLVGAPLAETAGRPAAGRVFVYDLAGPPAATRPPAVTVENGDASENDQFGRAIAINRRDAISGVPLDDREVDATTTLDDVGRVDPFTLDGILRADFE